jgi:acyl carrier protein
MIKKIIEILAEIKEDKTLINKLTPESNIVDEVGLDSLEMINFILMIEDEFQKEIDFEEFEFAHLETVGSLSSFLQTI